jgi:hypothetical protein
MLLGRQKLFTNRAASNSKEKNKSLVRVASTKKLPQDFFKNQSSIYQSCVPSNMLEFTFRQPLKQEYSLKPLKKCIKEVKPHAFLKLDRQGSGSKYMDIAQ